jgi:hypothetical protein
MALSESLSALFLVFVGAFLYSVIKDGPWFKWSDVFGGTLLGWVLFFLITAFTGCTLISEKDVQACHTACKDRGGLSTLFTVILEFDLYCKCNDGTGIQFEDDKIITTEKAVEK